MARGDVLTEDSSNCYLYSESRLVAAVGLEDHVVIETKDAVLVAPKDRVQDVKSLVSQAEGCRAATSTPCIVKSSGRGAATTASRTATRFQVKRLCVKPGAQLSLQLHHHRAEHWVVVSGTARITRGDETFLLEENQSTYIPMGVQAPHREPGQDPAAGHRGAIGFVSGRRRHRALRRPLWPRRDDEIALGIFIPPCQNPRGNDPFAEKVAPPRPTGRQSKAAAEAVKVVLASSAGRARDRMEVAARLILRRRKRPGARLSPRFARIFASFCRDWHHAVRAGLRPPRQPTPRRPHPRRATPTPPPGGLDARPSNTTCLATLEPGRRSGELHTGVPEPHVPATRADPAGTGDATKWYVAGKQNGLALTFDERERCGERHDVRRPARSRAAAIGEGGLLGMAFDPRLCDQQAASTFPIRRA